MEIQVVKMGVLQMKKEGKISVLILSVLEHISHMLVAKPNHLVMGRYLEKEAICMGINSHPSIVALRHQV